MYKTILFDQLTPVALYGKIKEIFPNEVTMLFESVVNTSDGNFSFITIGAQERLTYKDKKTTYTDKNGETKMLNEDPFSFLKTYYRSVDKTLYKQKSEEDAYCYEFPWHRLSMIVQPYWLSPDIEQATKVTLRVLNAKNKEFAEMLAEAIDEMADQRENDQEKPKKLTIDS